MQKLRRIGFLPDRQGSESEGIAGMNESPAAIWWKAIVTFADEQISPITFESFNAMINWLNEHHGEYTAFIAAEKEGTQTNGIKR